MMEVVVLVHRVICYLWTAQPFDSGVRVDIVPRELRQRFEEADQGQVFSFIDRRIGSLADHQKLIADLTTLDLPRVASLYRAAKAAEKSEASAPLEALGPAPHKEGVADKQRHQWRSAAYEAMRAGRVGVVLLAGGQGTRLGSDRPKGEYVVGSPSGKSLFEIQAQRLLRVKVTNAAAPATPLCRT